jgi:DNA modification methylase
MPEIKSESIHLVVTSPPYWNLKKYGEEGMGPNQAYAKYLYEVQSVLKEIKRVIAPGRFVAINVGTAVSNNGMKSINADIVRKILILLLRRRLFGLSQKVHRDYGSGE